MTGRQPWLGRDGVWVYPFLEYTMAEAGLQELGNYVSRRNNTVSQFNAIRHIMDLFMAADRRPGPMVSKRWWEKDRVDVEGMRTAAWEA